MTLPPRSTVVVRVQPSEAELSAGYLEAEKNYLKVSQLLLTHLGSPMGGNPQVASVLPSVAIP